MWHLCSYQIIIVRFSRDDFSGFRIFDVGEPVFHVFADVESIVNESALPFATDNALKIPPFCAGWRRYFIKRKPVRYLTW
jgi:hypothetical protein